MLHGERALTSCTQVQLPVLLTMPSGHVRPLNRRSSTTRMVELPAKPGWDAQNHGRTIGGPGAVAAPPVVQVVQLEWPALHSVGFRRCHECRGVLTLMAWTSEAASKGLLFAAPDTLPASCLCLRPLIRNNRVHSCSHSARDPMTTARRHATRSPATS